MPGTIGWSRGRAPPPNGTQFFHFRIHFHQKAPASEVDAPHRVDAPYGKSSIRHCEPCLFLLANSCLLLIILT